MRGAWVVLRKHSTLCSPEMAGNSQNIMANSDKGYSSGVDKRFFKTY